MPGARWIQSCSIALTVAALGQADEQYCAMMSTFRMRAVADWDRSSVDVGRRETRTTAQRAGAGYAVEHVQAAQMYPV
jgi:hypothetical protein